MSALTGASGSDMDADVTLLEPDDDYGMYDAILNEEEGGWAPKAADEGQGAPVPSPALYDNNTQDNEIGIQIKAVWSEAKPNGPNPPESASTAVEAPAPTPLTKLTFPCPYCRKAFKLRTKVHIHIRAFHAEEAAEEASAEIQRIDVPIPSSLVKDDTPPPVLQIQVDLRANDAIKTAETPQTSGAATSVGERQVQGSRMATRSRSRSSTENPARFRVKCLCCADEGEGHSHEKKDKPIAATAKASDRKSKSPKAEPKSKAPSPTTTATQPQKKKYIFVKSGGFAPPPAAKQPSPRKGNKKASVGIGTSKSKAEENERSNATRKVYPPAKRTNPPSIPENSRTCPWCNVEFEKQQSLAAHIRVHARDGWVAQRELHQVEAKRARED